MVAVRSVIPKPPSAFCSTIRQSPGGDREGLVDVGRRSLVGKVASPVDEVSSNRSISYWNGWPPQSATRWASPAARAVNRAWIPFVSGKSVPSNRAWAIVAEGASDWKVSVTSTIGAAVPVPWSVTCQFACAWFVLPVNVPFAMSLQPMTLAPTCRHMWVVPCGVLEASFAVTVPAKSLLNVMVRGCPAGSAVESSLRPMNVIEASGAGSGDDDAAALDDGPGVGSTEGVGFSEGATLGLPAGVADAAAWVGVGEAAGPSLRLLRTIRIATTTITSAASRPVTMIGRFRSFISTHRTPRPASRRVGSTRHRMRRRAIMAG